MNTNDLPTYHTPASVIRPRPSTDVDRSFKLSGGDVTFDETFDLDKQLEGARGKRADCFICLDPCI